MKARNTQVQSENMTNTACCFSHSWQVVTVPLRSFLQPETTWGFFLLEGGKFDK